MAVHKPLSVKRTDQERHYRVADPYLRLWLSLPERGISEVERGCGRLVAEAIERGVRARWRPSVWSGRVRQASGDAWSIASIIA